MCLILCSLSNKYCSPGTKFVLSCSCGLLILLLAIWVQLADFWCVGFGFVISSLHVLSPFKATYACEFYCVWQATSRSMQSCRQGTHNAFSSSSFHLCTYLLRRLRMTPWNLRKAWLTVDLITENDKNDKVKERRFNNLCIKIHLRVHESPAPLSLWNA